MSIRSFDGTFRLTPFRTAISKRLVTSDIAVDSSNYSTADDPVRDLLGMTDLRDRARQAFQKWWTAHGSEIAIEYEPALREFCRELFFWTSADRFFAAMPDADLYCPVPICLAHDRHRTWEDLTDLLLKTAGDSHGLLISARSGGGKTVGSWCAWFRCFSDRAWTPYPNQPGTNRLAPASADRITAPLAGFTPVWIDVAESALPEGNENDFILKLITRQCLRHLNLDEAAQLRLLERYLQLGSQKYLLFFDLNHAPAKTRDCYAEALIRFQERYGPQLGHRCIVIYRAAGQEDKVLHNLTHQGTRAPQFVEYDLLPLDDEVAIDYLSRIRKVENDLFDHLDLWLQDWSGKPDTRLPRSEHDPETELTHLKRLLRIRRRAAIRQRGTDDDLWEQETVISIPLLMHWVSTFPPEVLNRIKTLADIYAQLTQQHLQREESDENRTKTQISPEDLLIAMQRLALAMLAQQGETRLSATEAKRLLTRPQGGNTRIPVRRAWMPIGELLTQSLTYSRVFTEEEVAALFELGLLRKTDDSLGFAHDSLIYYFAARALREYEGIGLPSQDEPLDDAWPQAISETFLDDPARWLLVAEFLGEMVQTRDEGSGEEICRHNQSLLRELVSRLVAFWPDLPREAAIAFMEPVPELVSRLSNSQPHDRVLQQVYKASNDHSRFAWEHPHLLLQEVMNRCCWFGATGNEVEQWARQLDEFTGDGSRPEWIKKIKGIREENSLTIEKAHCDDILSLAIYEGTDGPHIVSVGTDKRIISFELQTGIVDWVINDIESDEMNSVAVYEGIEGPLIVVAGSHPNDTEIMIIDPELGKLVTNLKGHHGEDVLSLVTYECNNEFYIVSAGYEKEIVISNPQTKQIEKIIKGVHTKTINSLAVYEGPDGPRVVSVGEDKRIVISNPRTGTVERTIDDAHADSFAYTNAINSVVVYEGPNGLQIVSAGEDEWIVISDPRTGTVVRTIKGAHQSCINSLAVYEGPDGPRIVSVGNDSQIVISDPQTGQLVKSLEGLHVDVINCVANYQGSNGSYIITAGRDCRIVITDLQNIEMGIHSSKENTYEFRCVTVHQEQDEAQIIALVNDDDLMIIDSNNGQEIKSFKGEHSNAITSLAAYSGIEGSWLISVGWDSKIIIHDIHTGQLQRIITGAHTNWILGVAVFESSRGPLIVSAGYDKQIVFSNPQNGQIERSIKGIHSRPIICAALYEGPEGIMLISSTENEIRISDLENEQLIKCISRTHRGGLFGVDLYKGIKGPQLISAGWDGRLCFWEFEVFLTDGETTSIPSKPINTLFIEANSFAIDKFNNRLVCVVDNKLEIYEFVTN
ncbi:WD domain, G-beta repeat [Gimesia chilikensis]|uniref:WD domain, G-beta repeat n=2 Tax=Gimesia chilikensis TaxID=2605989 RepID=A0A517PSW8_9PLAN|nr:WD domain, G-beta repeat [Gimesia chilikensis]